MLNFWLGISFGIIIGAIATVASYIFYWRNIKNSLVRDQSNLFKEILEEISLGNSEFKSRINNFVEISIKNTSRGPFDLIYFIDKNDIALFKNRECIFTSGYCNPEIISRTTSLILSRYGSQIYNTVSILGSTMDTKTYNSLYSRQHTKKNLQIKSSYNIDDILDRINSIGYENLTKDEKDFLDNQSGS